MPTIDENFLIPILEKGDKLHHYTSAAGFQGICSGEFWITESHFLNDFTEFHVATDVFCEVMDNRVHNADVRERVKSKVLAEMERLYHCPKVDEEIAHHGEYVISFSLDYDSTLMWSEYSGFLGYCLKFDFEKLQKSFKKKDYLKHGQVIYRHEQQVSLIERALEEDFLKNEKMECLNSWDDFNHLSDEDIEDLYPFFCLEIDTYNNFFKLPCFEGEHEYRFIFSCGHDGGRYKPEELEKQYFRIKDEVLIPFIKKEMSSLESLEEVLIGPKNKSDIAVLGAEWFLRSLRLDVPVVKSKMPLRY